MSEMLHTDSKESTKKARTTTATKHEKRSTLQKSLPAPENEIPTKIDK